MDERSMFAGALARSMSAVGFVAVSTGGEDTGGLTVAALADSLEEEASDEASCAGVLELP